jgi:hypothetical protein
MFIEMEKVLEDSFGFSGKDEAYIKRVGTKFRTIEIGGETITSDIPYTHNVITVNESNNSAVIFTNQKVRTWVRPKDVTQLIKEGSWNCDFLNEKHNIINFDSGEIIGSKIIQIPRYISTTLCASNTKEALEKVSKYGLDPELPTIKKFIQCQKIKLFLHRYIAGMYTINTTRVIKEKFGISEEEFFRNGLKSLEVHHMEGDRMGNFSDKLTITTRKEHPRISKNIMKSYELYSSSYPIGTMSGKKVLQIKDIYEGNVLGLAIDTSDSGININNLKCYMVNETLRKRDLVLMSKSIDEAIDRLKTCNIELTEILFRKAEEMKAENKIQLVLF